MSLIQELRLCVTNPNGIPSLALCIATTALAAPATNNVRVLSIEGEAAQAEISRAGATAWDPAYVDQILRPGDRGRTGPRSKILLRMSDLSVLRVRERSQFEIKPPPEPAQPAGLALLKGLVYLFHRDKPGTTRIQSRTALAATRGTEFLVEVEEATDRMTLTLIDGEADLSNAEGTLALKTGEQGVAEPGQPPRKTAVICSVNLLQWCLYYPGVLDTDELEFSAETRETLSASLDAYGEGALPRALAAYPASRAPASPEEAVYLAALLLSVGQVDEAQALLDSSRLTPRAGLPSCRRSSGSPGRAWPSWSLGSAESPRPVPRWRRRSRSRRATPRPSRCKASC